MSDALINPFPGLRAYRKDERHLFFGRTEPANELIRRLGDSRFLAVVGTSGSGKSSLVGCGVLPALHGGFLSKAGSTWRVAILRPGNEPIGNRARALAEAGITALGTPGVADPAEATFVETVLRRGALGAVEAVRYARLEQDENVLIVVDQFEELFRLQSSMVAERPGDEAAAFVKLLVEAAKADARIYVMLTMRSDYLGLCTGFRDLPDVINDGLYLIPRMTRSQQRQTIEGPVAMGGATIAPRLIQRLLNDVGDDPDQLPILQHALMRTWDRWSKASQPPDPIDLDHYEQVGGMAGAMDQHAEEVMGELEEDQKKLAKRIFQTLTETAEGGRVIRRPATLDTVCDVVESARDRVEEVIDAFRRPGRAFLMPPAGQALRGSSPLDLSHESLIRIWKDLGKWVVEEDRSATTYKRLSERARVDEERLRQDREEGTATASLVNTGQRAWLALRNKADRLQGLQLENALDWREKMSPTRPWADRYDAGFDAAIRFLSQSETIARGYRRARWLSLVVFFASLVGVTGLAVFAKNRAVRAGIMELAASRSDPLEGALILAALEGTADVDGQGAQIAFDLARRSIPSAVWADSERIPITSVAFDGSGTRVLVVERAVGEARLLDAETGAELGVPVTEGTRNASFIRVEGDSGDPRIAVFSSEWLRTMNLDGTGRDSIPIPSQSSSANFVAFSRDGTRLAVGTSESIRLWTTTAHRDPIRLPQNSESAVWKEGKFSADGSRFASWRTGDSSNVMSVWDVDWDGGDAPDPLLLEHPRRRLGDVGFEIRSFGFSPTGEQLVTAAWDSLRIWDAIQGDSAVTIRSEPPARWVTFDPTGRRVVGASSDGSARLWDAVTGGLASSHVQNHGTVRDVIFSQNGARGLTTYADSTSRVWDTGTGRTLQVLEGYGASLGPRSRFSLDGSRVVTADSAGEVRIWPAEGTRWFQTLWGHRDGVNAIALSPDGALVATAGADSTVRFWDTGDADAAGDTLRHDEGVTAIAFSGDSVLAAASGTRAWVWSLRRRDTLFTVGHDDYVTSVAFSPDGQWLLTGSADETAGLWNARTGEPMQDPETGQPRTLEHDDGVYSVAFAPDGRIVTGSDDLVAVWSETGERIREIEDPLEGEISSVAISPGGQLVTSSLTSALIWELDGDVDAPQHTLATGSNIRSIAIAADTLVFTAEQGQGAVPARVTAWSLRTGELLYVLGSHPREVRGIAVAADLSLVATASADGTARLWPLDWDGLLRGLRDRATHACLTVSQRQQVLGESENKARGQVRACQDEYQTITREENR